MSAQDVRDEIGKTPLSDETEDTEFSMFDADE